MGLADSEGKKHKKLSSTKVARVVPEGHGKYMALADIINVAQEYLGTSDEEIRECLPQFYTDTNTDGEFVLMGDSVWTLCSWFPYESVSEEVNHPENENDELRKEHHRKVNTFITSNDGDDIIDYDSDDPEDGGLDTEDDGNVDDSDATDGDDFDDTGDDDELPDGIEGQLSESDDKDDEGDE